MTGYVSALGKGSATSAGHFPGIRGIDELLEVWVFEVLAEAGLLLLDLAAAQSGRRGCGCNCAHARAELYRLARHSSLHTHPRFR